MKLSGIWSDVELPPLIAWAMAERLVANDHKGGWQQMSPKRLLVRAEQELAELRRAIEAQEPPERIAQEAGDVANFLGMLVAQYGDNHEAAASPETTQEGDHA